jgi:hypothetical protein
MAFSPATHGTEMRSGPDPGCGDYFLFFEAGFAVLGPGLLFASGLRIVQSDGGKEMRQNPRQGFIKSTPTSRFSDWWGLRYTTRHDTSSPVPEFRSISICPTDTFKPSMTLAPCAFTVTVLVASETTLLSAPRTRITTETLSMTRWLRR